MRFSRLGLTLGLLLGTMPLLPLAASAQTVINSGVFTGSDGANGNDGGTPTTPGANGENGGAGGNGGNGYTVTVGTIVEIFGGEFIGGLGGNGGLGGDGADGANGSNGTAGYNATTDQYFVQVAPQNGQKGGNGGAGGAGGAGGHGLYASGLSTTVFIFGGDFYGNDGSSGGNGGNGARGGDGGDIFRVGGPEDGFPILGAIGVNGANGATGGDPGSAGPPPTDPTLGGTGAAGNPANLGGRDGALFSGDGGAGGNGGNGGNGGMFGRGIFADNGATIFIAADNFSFDGTLLTGSFGGFEFEFTAGTANGGQILPLRTVSVNAPEPGTLALVATGGLLMYRRTLRRKRSAAKVRVS